MKNNYEAYPFGENEPKVMRPGGLLLTEELILECRLREAAVILDIGCGLGTTVKHLKSKYHYEAMGIDYSEKLISEGLSTMPNLSIQVGNAEGLPFENETMDCVLMECSLSVFQSTEKVLKEAYRVLKLGGKLAISDVYIKSDLNVKYEPCTGVSSAFTREIFECKLKNQGFKTIKWSEKTALWRSYIAEMIWNQSGNDNHDFLSEFCTLGGTSGAKLGYFSLIAEKEIGGDGDE